MNSNYLNNKYKKPTKIILEKSRPIEKFKWKIEIAIGTSAFCIFIQYLSEKVMKKLTEITRIS